MIVQEAIRKQLFCFLLRIIVFAELFSNNLQQNSKNEFVFIRSFIPLLCMKKKQLILSFSFAVTILFSILFQSIHSYEHIVKQLSEKQCHHDYNDPSGEITHQHHNYDLCYVCNFAFGSYIVPESFSFKFNSFDSEIPYFFPLLEKVFSISKTSYLLRGPPAALVS